jgi:hypothetical protein
MFIASTWLRTRVRRLAGATALGVALMAVVAAPGAFGANPQGNHFHDVFTDTDPDFCDTGQQIELAFDIRVNEWLAPNQPVDFRQTASGTITSTNPLTGDTVVQHFAGPSSVVLVSGDLEGLFVQDVTVSGLAELIKAPHGRVLTLDAGLIVLRQTFDGDELISVEILTNNGPHPEAESDFELFCQVMTEALGI